MGIEYFEVIRKRLQPDTMKTDNSQTRYLFVDANSMIYSACKSSKIFASGTPNTSSSYPGVEQEITITATFDTIVEAIVVEFVQQLIQIHNLYTPILALRLFFDGVAPLPKIVDQRRRRFSDNTVYVNNGKVVFSTAMIYPGSKFMLTFAQQLQTRINAQSLLENIVSCDFTGVGEGEHKIIQHIARLSPSDRNTIYVMGNDNDLFLLLAMMYSRRQSLKLLYARQNQSNVVEFFDIGVFCAKIQELKLTASTSTSQIISAFYLVMSPFGNDFLPTAYQANEKKGQSAPVDIKHLFEISCSAYRDAYLKHKSDWCQLTEDLSPTRTSPLNVEPNHAFLLDYFQSMHARIKGAKPTYLANSTDIAPVLPENVGLSKSYASHKSTLSLYYNRTLAFRPNVAQQLVVVHHLVYYSLLSQVMTYYWDNCFPLSSEYTENISAHLLNKLFPLSYAQLAENVGSALTLSAAAMDAILTRQTIFYKTPTATDLPNISNPIDAISASRLAYMPSKTVGLLIYLPKRLGVHYSSPPSTFTGRDIEAVATNLPDSAWTFPELLTKSEPQLISKNCGAIYDYYSQRMQ